MKIVLYCIATNPAHDVYAVHVMQKWAWIGAQFRNAGHDVVFIAREKQPGPRLQNAPYLPPEEIAAALDGASHLFIWNGALACQKGAAAIAHDAGAVVLYAELGWLPQYRTCYFDHQGVGPRSSISAWTLEGRRLSETESVVLHARLDHYKDFLIRCISPEPADVWPRKPFVLAPLQVEDDSQIVLHGPKYRDMQVFIDEVAAMRPGKQIVYKLHPKADRTRASYRWPPGSLAATRGLADLLVRCDEIITVNSTVGLEGIAFYKPVTALGEAFWAKWGPELHPSRRDAFLYELFRRQWNEAWLRTPRVLGLLEGDLRN